MKKKSRKDVDLDKQSLAQIHREILDMMKKNLTEGNHWIITFSPKEYYELFKKKNKVMVLYPEDYYEEYAIPFTEVFKLDTAKEVLEKLQSSDYDDVRSIESEKL